MKALHHAEPPYLNVPAQSPRYIALSHFIGECHHRLASLYHKTATTTTTTVSYNLEFLEYYNVIIIDSS